jgi:hypothetical protein
MIAFLKAAANPTSHMTFGFAPDASAMHMAAVEISCTKSSLIFARCSHFVQSHRSQPRIDRSNCSSYYVVDVIKIRAEGHHHERLSTLFNMRTSGVQYPLAGSARPDHLAMHAARHPLVRSRPRRVGDRAATRRIGVALHVEDA